MTDVFSVIAATIYGNRGAQAMLETVIGRLREQRPDAKFHVFSYYPKDDRRLLTANHVFLHSGTPVALTVWLLPLSLLFGVLRWIFGKDVLRIAPRPIRALGESTALIDLAGVSFIDGREKFLPFNTLTLLPAWLLGTPIVKMPQAVGPFNSTLNRLAAAFVLPKCAKVWARGGCTWRNLQESGFRRIDFAIADDITFNHKPEYSLSQEAGFKLERHLVALTKVRNMPSVRSVIGVCPSSVVAAQAHRRGDNYEAALTHVATELARQGILVVFFPNATRDAAGNSERNNDLPVIRRVLAGIPSHTDPAPLAFDFDMNATEIRRIIAETDVVLVSRFHAMVGALSLGVPAVVLGWSHKYAELMARFGQETCVMDYKNMSALDLCTKVVAVFEQRDEIRSRILERLPEIKALAATPVDLLLTPRLGSELA